MNEYEAVSIEDNTITIVKVRRNGLDVIPAEPA